MPVTTRSVTNRLFMEDTLKAPFKIDVLTTPGIASNIAKHLDNDDEDLKSMFLLINNNNFRHELMMYCGDIKQKYHDRLLELERENQELLEHEKQREIERVKMKEIMDNIGQYLKINTLTEGEEYRKLSIFAMYEYFCDVQNDLHLLGAQFASAIYKNFNQIVAELEHDVEGTNKLYEFEHRLQDYLEFGFNAYYDHEYYNELNNDYDPYDEYYYDYDY